MKINKFIILALTLCTVVSSCNTSTSNNTKQQMSAKELAQAKKAKIQAGLDTIDANALIGNIRLMMSKSDYDYELMQLQNETYVIRIADAEFNVGRFKSKFNKNDQLVALGLISYGKYQTFDYIKGLDNKLNSVEDYLYEKYGEPDSTDCTYQTNYIPYQEHKEWIFNQRAIVQKVQYSKGDYKGEFDKSGFKGKVYEGTVDYELWYYSPQYYLEEKIKNEEAKQINIANKNRAEEKERSYSTNL